MSGTLHCLHHNSTKSQLEVLEGRWGDQHPNPPGASLIGWHLTVAWAGGGQGEGVLSAWPERLTLGSLPQSFTRLTELVLQAHRKELDGLRSYAADELNLAELEEEECKPEGVENSPKACWC